MDQTNDTLLFSGRANVNGTATTAEVTASGEVRWTDGGGGRRRLAVEKEVIGFLKDGCCKVIVHAVLERGEETIVRSGGNNGGMVRKRFLFEVEDEEFGRGLCENIQRCIDSLGRPKRLFVLVNPFGGSKCASKIFLDDVKPLLEDANVVYTLQETKHRLHAKEVAFSLDLSKYDGIVCVSGDGTLVEVVNGLLERADWENAIKTALGVVPAGTGNGMAKSLLDSVGLPCTAFHATLAIIRGHKRRLDVTTVLQGETKFFSVLMLAWGLVADIDIESEKYRWMGKARFDVYGLQRVFSLRKYNGCISFVPAPGFEGIGEPSDRNDEPLCKKDEVQQCGYLGPDIDLGSSKWRKMNGPFVSVWLHNVPWGAEETKAAPDAKFSDGYLDLILIRDCPKFALLTLMTELSNGNHVKSPHVSYLKVKAFVLEPGSRTDDPTKGGIIDVDGEVLARGKGTYKAEQKALMKYDKLQLIVDHGLATIFTPI